MFYSYTLSLLSYTILSSIFHFALHTSIAQYIAHICFHAAEVPWGYLDKANASSINSLKLHRFVVFPVLVPHRDRDWVATII